MIYIYGASGHGKVVSSIILANKMKDIVFLDDADKGGSFFGYPCYPPSRLTPAITDKFIIGIGSNWVRQKISNSLKVEWLTTIHPSAVVADDVTIGEGTVVMPGAIINSGVTIGSHVIVNTGAVIDHDCVLDDFVHISPNATLCGNVSVAKGSWIGAGSVIIQNVRVDEWSIIGAGSVVLRDISQDQTWVGNPAYKLDK